MRRYTVAAAGAVIVLTGCAAPPPPLSVDPRVWVRPDAGVRLDTPLIVTKDARGFVRVSAELHNIGPVAVTIACNTDWFDATGHPIPGLAATPTRISVPPYATEFCTTVSPNGTTSGFRIAVVPTL